MSSWMDRLLRETFDRRTAERPPGACLDAETAAAFVDEALSSRERSRLESHVADCARCQTLVAAIARTLPPPAPRVWWRKPAVAWLAPIAVAAAAIIVWVTLPRQDVPQPVAQMTRDAAPAPPQVSHDTAAPPPVAAPSAAARTLARERRQKQESVRKEARDHAATPTETGAAAQLGMLADSRAAVAAPAAEAPAAPLAESVIVSTESQRVIANRLQARADSAIASPDAIVRWRIGADGTVFHTTDGGSTWEPQATGVNVTLTAGSSPSREVCWLVGPRGTVVITTDQGRSWQRIAFPVATDLVSIRASDDKTAVVLAADRRAFSTTDRGATWTR